MHIKFTVAYANHAITQTYNYIETEYSLLLNDDNSAAHVGYGNLVSKDE